MAKGKSKQEKLDLIISEITKLISELREIAKQQKVLATALNKVPRKGAAQKVRKAVKAGATGTKAGTPRKSAVRAQVVPAQEASRPGAAQ